MQIDKLSQLRTTLNPAGTTVAGLASVSMRSSIEWLATKEIHNE